MGWDGMMWRYVFPFSGTFFRAWLVTHGLDFGDSNVRDQQDLVDWVSNVEYDKNVDKSAKKQQQQHRNAIGIFTPHPPI